MTASTPFRAPPARRGPSSPGLVPEPARVPISLPKPPPVRPGFVLGIDPGTRVLGFGAVELTPRGPRLIGAGVLRPTKQAAVPQRLAELRAGLDRLLFELRPEVVVIEQAFARLNIQSALRMGEGRGVVLAAAAAAGARIVQVAPAAAKKALVGNGQAHKTQVAAMVARVLGLERAPEPLDATDALALALSEILRRSWPA